MLEQERLQPAHPGDVLAGEFIAPKGRIAGDTALRLAVAFGTTAEFWMGLQMRWALAVAARRGWARFPRSDRRATIVARPAT